MQSTVPVPLIQEDARASGIVRGSAATRKSHLLAASSNALKTLIVVKNEDTAFQLRSLFRSDPRFEVVSDCVSELEVASVLERTNLDVLVIDLNLPQLGSRPFLAAMHRLGRVLFVLDPNPKLEGLLQNKGLPYLRRECDPGQFQAVATKLAQSAGVSSRANAQKLMRLLSGRYRVRSRRLAIRAEDRLLVLDQGEIYSVEADGKTTWIHLALESHQVAEPFSQLARRLDSDKLLKVNRRVLVNVIHVKGVSVVPREGCSVWLHNDRTYRLPLHCARRIRKVVEALCKS